MGLKVMSIDELFMVVIYDLYFSVSLSTIDDVGA